MTKTVIITRPDHMATSLIAGLRRLGLQYASFPLFDIEAQSDTSELDAQLRNLSGFRLVVFVSPNAISVCMRRLVQLGLTWPLQLAIGVMGEASKQALYAHGVDVRVPVFAPIDTQRTDSETLFASLDLAALRGQTVLIVRGDSGREFLADALTANGVQVVQISAYRRVIPCFDAQTQLRLGVFLSQSNDWIITSSSVLGTLLDWCRQLDARDASVNAVVKMQQQHLVVPHFRIAEVAKNLGFSNMTLSASGDENLLQALQSQS